MWTFWLWGKFLIPFFDSYASCEWASFGGVSAGYFSGFISTDPLPLPLLPRAVLGDSDLDAFKVHSGANNFLQRSSLGYSQIQQAIMNKGMMSICFSVCNYNAASPLWKFMPRKGFFFC